MTEPPGSPKGPLLSPFNVAPLQDQIERATIQGPFKDVLLEGPLKGAPREGPLKRGKLLLGNVHKLMTLKGNKRGISGPLR